MDTSRPCKHCVNLSDALGHYETSLAQGGHRLYYGQVDFYLGRSVDLEMRASEGCYSCRSILNTRYVSGLQEKFGEIYSVSAHFSAKQALLFLRWGNLDQRNEDPAHRRASVFDLISTSLNSTNPILSQTQLGRARPYDVDCYNVNLIRRWIERCDKHHQSTCFGNHDSFLLPTAKLNFIDVEERCLVTPDHPVRYAALSYVWGIDKVPLATKATIESLKLPGAFSTGGFELPATIDDAVRFCSWIGIRYLWVDSMCIVQDDDKLRTEHIQAMGSVYSNAYLTIAALSPESASAGLPRVTKRSEVKESFTPSLVRLPSQTLMQATSGSIGLGPLTMSGGRWKWTTRAWTFQELIFSKRVLGLGPVATWTCSGAFWTEEFEVQSELEGQSAFMEEKSPKPSVTVWPSMSQYGSLAAIYAKRNLTWPSDTVNAFDGVMTPMSQWFPGGFFYGIPEFTFDIGLLWQYRRRGAKPRSGKDWSQEQHDFPSWSWISYQGYHLETFWQVDFAYPQPEMTVYPLVEWKKQEKATGEWKKIDNSYHQVRKHFEKPETPLPSGWTKHSNGSDPPYYQHPSHDHVQPHPKFSYPIPPFQRYRDINKIECFPHLLFDGSIASVRFKFRGTPEEVDSTNEKLKTDALVPELDIVNTENEAWVGRIRLDLQPGSTLPEYQEKQEVIAISEASIKLNVEGSRQSEWSELSDHQELKSGGSYHFVNVLWIGWTVDGKVYRKAWGRIWREAWEKMTVDKISVLLT